MKKTALLMFILIFTTEVYSQALYQVSNTEKVASSTLVVEGKVVEQSAFWNSGHTMIYTNNKIKVYKIFKGQLAPDYIEVITQGGNVGGESITVSDLAELEKNEIGIFFCYPNSFNLKSASGNLLFDIYASAQGFIKYNIEGNKAACPFNLFTSITNELYPLLKNLTGHDYVVKDASLIIGNAGGLLFREAALITSFSPNTVNAGATSDPGTNVLTITGTGFGLPGGTAAIKFSDANAGIGSGVYFTVDNTSSLIISWTDTEIKLMVPGRAGTGNIVVRDATGNENTSTTFLNVFYSCQDVSISGVNKQLNLINANSQGGYNMLYSSNMTAEATTTYNRALKTWIDLAGFNVRDAGNTAITKAASDGNCVVFLDNADNGTPLAAGVLAACYTYGNTCLPAASNLYRRPEFDIIIRSSYSTGTISFDYGPCPPLSSTIDLETVILHELGHAINLGHVNDGVEGSGSDRNPAKLMNFSVSSGVKRTAPDAAAYQGALYLCATNNSANFGNCTATNGHIQLPLIRDSKDECPLIFPTSATPLGTRVTFDLAHATSNKFRDPGYTNILCNAAGTNVTNNLYYVLKTNASGSLDISVSNFTPVPAEAASCVRGSSPTGRISLYQVSSCPFAQEFPPVLACLSFTGDGPLSSINGLAANTNYLMYVDGRASAKASFDLTFGGNVLPIKLENFSGQVSGAVNELKWMIASFSDVNKILLERSADGVNFTSIKEYGGVALLTKQYLHNDVHPFAGNNYYRLATYNKDGSVQYSAIVLLKRSDKMRFTIFPNPVKSNLNISISSVENAATIQIKLYNSAGQLVLTQKNAITTGVTSVTVKADKLTPGTYLMVITDKANTIVKTQNIQKL